MQGGPPAADRILVIRLGALGDVVRSLPAVSALRAAYPAAQITWLVEPAAASVLVGQPCIDGIQVFPRDALHSQLRSGSLWSLARDVRRFVRLLRAERFDLVVDFHSILRSSVLSRISGAPLRVAYAPPFGREASHLLANRLLWLPAQKMSRFERNAALVRFLDVSSSPAASPLRLPGDVRARMVEALAGRAAAVVIHPGTSASTPYKRYPVASFAEVAVRLQRETGLACLVTRGPSSAEIETARAIVERAGGAAELAPETPTLLDLAALFASSRLAIAGDTGPLHLAALAGTPVVQLLGPTDPVENAPWQGVPSRSLRAGLACSPCRRGCKAATCMQVLAPEQVVVAARELLAGMNEGGLAGAAT
jgi:ADP-heptose:LPS heptosyltransferase